MILLLFLLSQNYYFTFNRQLIRLLKDESTHTETLEIASYDLGEYVRYYNRGKV